MANARKTWRTPISKCQACDYKLDSVSSLTEAEAPKPGDVTICLKCGHLMGFNPNLSVRPLTDEEMLDAAGNKDILDIQTARGALPKDWRK